MRAGLVSYPGEYRWSSVNVYQSTNDVTSFVKSSFVLGLLARDLKEQQEIYAKLLHDSMGIEADDALEKSDAVSFFRKILARNFPNVFSLLHKQKQVAPLTGLELLDDEEIEKKIREMRERKTNNTPEEKSARKFLVQQLIARGYKRKEIAEKLGVSVKTVYNILKA